MEGKYSTDKYDHPDQDVMYITSNIPGPRSNLDHFQSVFTTGCLCQTECQENCSCTQPHTFYVKKRFIVSKQVIMVFNSNCICNEKCENRVL